MAMTASLMRAPSARPQAPTPPTSSTPTYGFCSLFPASLFCLIGWTIISIALCTFTATTMMSSPPFLTAEKKKNSTVGAD